LVVDQLGAWIAEERLPELPPTGGFARLRREGTWLTNVRLPYAVTDTAPGHASLHTGVLPAESGIWGNEVPLAGGGRVTFLRDPATKVVTPNGLKDAPGASADRLKVDNVADRLRAARPDALTVSISLKDRGAIMPGGHRPSFALWFEVAEGSFVTSTAFASAFPAWARAGDAESVTRARAVAWTISDPAWLARHVTVPDDAPGEGDLGGYGTTFPHVARSSAAFRASPASDRMIFDLALRAIDAEARPDRPTLLLLSLSANDIVGHVFGVDSWEAWDHLYKLDASLGQFLAALDARHPGAAVLLSADHGSSSMLETVRLRRPARCGDADPYERPCTPGVRISPTELERELRSALGPELFFGLADPYIFLTEAGRASPRSDAAVRRVLARYPGLELFDVATLAAECPHADGKLALVCRGYAPNRGAGDYYMLPGPGVVFDAEVVPGKGGSHGGPYLHDRTVPLLVRGAGADVGRVVRDPVDFSVYARVLEAALGLRPTNAREIVQNLRLVR